MQLIRKWSSANKKHIEFPHCFKKFHLRERERVHTLF